MSFFRSNALVEEELKAELEKLSAKELSLKFADQKEGEDLVDKVLANEDLLLLILSKAAGTKERKQSVSQENHGRFYSPVPFSEEVVKENHGLYLLDICKASKKFEEFLFAKEKSLKAKGVIDEQVINDLRKASIVREVQFVSLARFNG